MSKYYVSGYTTPEDVKSSSDVKRYQKMLGVACDGIWGEKTQKAYEKYSAANKTSGATASFTGDFDFDGASSYMSDRFSQMLRPAVDIAVEQRKKATDTNKAEIDADAAARGMGSSTFVSSMKERENSYEQDDIANIESSYQSNLASVVYSAVMSLYETYSENKIAEENRALEREKLQQENKQFESQLALEREKLEESKKAAASASADADLGPDGFPKLGYTYYDYYQFVLALTVSDRKKLFRDDGVYWRWARDQIIADLGIEGYYQLYNQYCNDRKAEYENKTGGYPLFEVVPEEE